MAFVAICASISAVGICHEVNITEKSAEISRANMSEHAENLAKEMPDGFYEVVGYKSGNDESIHFGRFTNELKSINNIKMLSKHYLLFSHWEDPKIQKYYPYSYSILWDKNGNTLRWHIFMNHTGNAKTGHPAFSAYFETVGKLEGSRLENMALVKGSETCLFLQKNAYGKKYNFSDITSRLAKPKHMAAYSKSVQWVKAKKTKGFGTLYEFNEINTAKDNATIAAQEAKEGQAAPIGFGSIRHLLVGNIHAQLTYVVRKVNQDYFNQSVKAGKVKQDCS